MLQQINNINFKSIYYGGDSDFSESQKKVVDDIKIKLGKTVDDNNFLIKALNHDVVELSEIKDVKTVGTGIDKKIEFSKGVFIGKYDEKHPFEREDYSSALKERARGFSALVVLALIYFAAIFALMPWKKNNSEAVTQQAEKVVTTAKDSLQMVRDSLKVVK